MDDEPPRIEPGPADLPDSNDPPLSYTYTAVPPESPPGGTKGKSGCGSLILGGFLCVVLLGMLGASGNWMLCLIGTPLAGVALTLSKGTRDIGLGILLTYGFLAITFWAICGRGGMRM
jgi:hypothetical protein